MKGSKGDTGDQGPPGPEGPVVSIDPLVFTSFKLSVGHVFLSNYSVMLYPHIWCVYVG